MADVGLIDQAIAHHQSGRLDQAAELYRRILADDSRHVDALHLLGVVAYQGGDDLRAVELIGRAIAINPGQSVFHNILGLVLHRLGKLDGAERSLRRAVSLDDVSAQAHHNLGAVQAEQGRFDDAIASFTRAVAIDPHYANAHCGLGDALQSVGKLNDALLSYSRTVELNEQMAQAWYGMGCAQSSLGDYAAAIESLRQAVDADNTMASARHNLGQALFKLGQVDQALEQFRQAASLADGGISLGAIATAIPGSPQADHWAIAEARRAWSDANASKVERPHSWPGAGSAANGRLRVGYISAFFGHRNWMKPVWGLINQHDCERFEVHLFSDMPKSRIEDGHRPHPQDSFYDITSLTNDAVVRLVEDCGIDILIDLNGYSCLPRLSLFAMKPAPVIVGWFNMFATTGLDCFDYLIGDDHVIRHDEEAYYTEQIVRVAGSYLTFDVTYPVPAVIEPACVRRGGFTFGCLASQYKITTEVIGAWAQILHQCPESRLIIKNITLGSQGNCRFVHGLFESFGISPDRVELEGPSEHFTFLEKYGDIDVALDTFPYNGGTTTMEALWQGVPVLTFDGDRWASRTSVSIMHNAGLGQYVARDVQGYIEKAVTMVNDAEIGSKLSELRLGMRSRLAASAVCDTRTFAREMEKAYTWMWGRRDGG